MGLADVQVYQGHPVAGNEDPVHQVAAQSALACIWGPQNQNNAAGLHIAIGCGLPLRRDIRAGQMGKMSRRLRSVFLQPKLR